MKKTLLIFAVACSLLAFAGGQRQPIGAGTTAPNYKFQNAANKKSVNFYGFKGKYKAIVLDFFASWCGPCQRLIPGVIEMHKKYGNKGVLFVGVDVFDKWADMQQNIKEKKIPYLVLHDPAAKGGVSALYKVDGIPVLFIIDGKTMKVQGNWAGYDPNEAKRRAEQEKVINRLVAGK